MVSHARQEERRPTTVLASLELDAAPRARPGVAVRTEIRHDGITLDVECHAAATPGAPAVLVLPGGGFREHTGHDGTGYARWLTSLGVGAVVLRHRMRPDPFPLALQQARAALDALQQGVLLPGTDPARVGVVGSSGGGLLAGLLATGAVLSVEEPPSVVPRPAFHIQAHGLADLALLPRPAVEVLPGDALGLAAELSPVAHVDDETPPTFIWATAQDGPGLPDALAWTQALADQGVPVELHVYPEGRHGVGLADGVVRGAHGDLALPHTAQWTGAFRRWLEHLGVLREADGDARPRSEGDDVPARVHAAHPVFPTADVERTTAYYRDVLGFTVVPYLDVAEPHVCLYRGGAEIILTVARPGEPVQPHRVSHGYGYDAYLVTDQHEAMEAELVAAGATLVRQLGSTDYGNRELVVEDVDGRWIGIGIKTEGAPA